MEERAKAGRALWHPADARFFGDPVTQEWFASNVATDNADDILSRTLRQPLAVAILDAVPSTALTA